MKTFLADYKNGVVDVIKAYTESEARAKAAPVMEDAKGKQHFLWDVYEV